MKSIVAKEFQNEVTEILQLTYANIVSLYVAQNYFKCNLSSDQKILDILPNKFPYSYYNVSKNDFLNKINIFEKSIYQNCMVNLIISIENFCYEALERYYILNIQELNAEESKLSFTEIYAHMQNARLEIVLCKILVERKLRNETTKNMLEKLGRITKNGFVKTLENHIEKIDKYSLVRNCIVHNQSRVSRDLSVKYNSEFGSIDEHINIDHKMCVDLSQTILDIVSEFDALYSKNVIKNYDAIALTKEFFILRGDSDYKIHKRMIDAILGRGKVTREIIDKSLSELKNQKADIFFEQICNKASRLIQNYHT